MTNSSIYLYTTVFPFFFWALPILWRADCGGVIRFVLGGGSAEELQLLFHVHLRHHLLLLPLPSAVHLQPAQHPRGGEPGVLQDLPGGEALCRIPTQYGAYQAFGLWRQRLRDVKVAPADFAEQRSGLDVVERVAPHQDGVKHDAQAPDVGRLARIAAAGVEDLRADVGRTAMFVWQGVVKTSKDIRVLKALQFNKVPANKGETTHIESFTKKKKEELAEWPQESH